MSTVSAPSRATWTRRFARPVGHPFDAIRWETRPVEIRDADGAVIFRDDFEAPDSWSDRARQIVSSKYCYGKPGDANREGSARTVIGRVARKVGEWGFKQGYFATAADAVSYEMDLIHLLVRQFVSFNSPVWFNVGHDLHPDRTPPSADNWTYRDGAAVPNDDVFLHPQVHACFIQPVEDSIAGIMALAASEALVFKYGSGSGTDLSTLRSTKERVSGGGRPSGPVSFMRIYDSVAATIKSGGKCLPGYQKVWTTDGPRPVSELSGTSFLCLSYDPPSGRYKVKRASASPSAIKRVVRVTTDKGQFDLSADHNVRLAHGDAIPAGRLAAGMRLFAASVHQAGGYIRVGLHDGRKGKMLLHRMIAADVMKVDITGKHVHHGNGRREDNRPRNFEVMSPSDHAALHGRRLAAEGSHQFQANRYPKAGAANGMHRDSDFWRSEEAKTYRASKAVEIAPKARGMQEQSARAKMMNTAWRLINAGWSIATFDDYCVARHDMIGRFNRDKVWRSIVARFGSYDEFASAVDRENHRVVSVEDVGDLMTYTVEVECPTADDKSPESGHTFVIWDHATDSIEGRGICVFNTRRAAKMQTLKCWHPDILEFVQAKWKEEVKARALIAAGYPGGMDGEAYSTVAFQNCNMSVRVDDTFMEMALDPTGASGRYPLWSVTQEKVVGHVDAGQLLAEIARCAWECGDPAVQFEDRFQEWHTTPNAGPINSTNPCGEFSHIDNSACNLATLRLTAFLDPNAPGGFDFAAFADAVEILIVAQDIIIGPASYPTAAIAIGANRFRQLGINYADLGGLLMRLGVPYDSDEGRDLAAALAAIMTGAAYGTSARLARQMGPFEGYAADAGPMLGVIDKHWRCAVGLGERVLTEYDADSPVVLAANEAVARWDHALALGREHGFRHAQASLLAPTGTIAFMMDCDTLGVEPEIALVRYKSLAGGGRMKIVNECVRAALRSLGYDEATSNMIVGHIDKYDTIEPVGGGESGLESAHLPVFDCALPPSRGDLRRSLSADAHLGMMAAVQPFLSGAISKTINLPGDATVDDVFNIYINAWKMGLKSVTVYRDGCKGGQPVTTAPVAPGGDAEGGAMHERNGHAGGRERRGPSPPVDVPPPDGVWRRKLANTRDAMTHKFEIRSGVGTFDFYITCGYYEDGALGEVFLKSGTKMGSALGGLLDVVGVETSLLLQYGVPLDVLAAKFSHAAFEPSGPTGNPEIAFAKSPIDYVFRWLVLSHEPAEGVFPFEEGPGDAPPADLVPTAGPAAVVTGDICPSCHNPHLVREGNCWRCHSCLWISGGCGG